MTYLLSALLLSLAITSVASQENLTVPNTWPQNYTGIPSGDYSPEWQRYYEVTEPLPNVTEPISRSFAGSISTNRAGHPNDTLFFWGFERENGSLTAKADERSNEPWLIWLNGGPGSSSFFGFFRENGPLSVNPDFSISPNNYSWHLQADAFWIDQPVGTGFSTADSQGGYVFGEEQMADDFVGFLSNLVKVFPSLAKRPLYLTGESYAGVYIPYISRALFGLENPPVKLAKIAIGNGAIGSFANTEQVSVVTVLETYPQIIDFDTEVLEYFRTQHHLCGYDLNLTYPQNGTFPSLRDPLDSPSLFLNGTLVQGTRRSSLKSLFMKNAALHRRDVTLISRDFQVREEKKRVWKRDLRDRANGTLDPWYGCWLYEEMNDYAINFTFPWTNGGFDPYFVPDALNPEVNQTGEIFLNDDRTRRALHAPTSKNWTQSFRYSWNSSYDILPGSNVFGDPSVEPMAFLTELATNASAHNVPIVIYSANDDALVAHRGTEVTIQNTTFGGIQGFTRKPSTPWYDDSGRLAGIVHQERNWTYALFLGAGHEVPKYQPQSAWVFLREFILGSNTTGLLLPNSTTPIGGEDSRFFGDIVPGTSVIFYGSSTTASSTIAPSASFASWASYLATATLTDNGRSITPTATVASSAAP